MLDFLTIAARSTKRGVMEIYPKFIIKKSTDLMIRGGDFYAIWIEELGLWSTDEQDAIQLIDKQLDEYAEANRQKFDANIKVLHMWDAETGMIDTWHRYCQKQMRDSFHMLDENLIFSNSPTNKNDYASKRLNYPLEKGSITSYEKIMSTLYVEEERSKIEWVIGSIVNGDSKKLQKFMVLYGSAGTGKSTVINIIQQLFEGYYSVFDAKALGSSSNSFALEAFKTNPLVAIQHDGDLSKIEDNTRLNSLVSHELMTVNEKFKATYSNRFKSFLIMGTNKPVKITDAKSGLIRRLIDVSPSGNLLSASEYKSATDGIKFELGAIAYHCMEVYNSNPHKYDNYIPVAMLGSTNDFYNFVMDSYFVFKKENGTSLKAAWEMYKNYCEDAKVPYPLSQRAFKEELKNYFDDFKERARVDGDLRVRNYYEGFKSDKFENEEKTTNQNEEEKTWIEFKQQVSVFDKEASKWTAQYASEHETPMAKWERITTTLNDLDTSKLHYVLFPEEYQNHIIIDFDKKDENGNKSLELNMKAANKWPPTYAELSKSGMGIHLHYIYNGDVSKLAKDFEEDVEIKVYKGNGSLRRKLSKCNDLDISTISSGLPIKEDNKVINFDAVKSEKTLRKMIIRNLNKEIHSNTKCSVDFIYKILEDAYNSGLNYDVSDMKNSVLQFAMGSTNQSDTCVKMVQNMKFKSEEISKNTDESVYDQIVFYDVEVFPNLFLVNWKLQDTELTLEDFVDGSVKTKGHKMVRMINPSPAEIEELLKYKLVGFNCRRYDNHMLYARLMGYTNEQLYNLSQRIISGSSNAMFGEAYNLSYTDVYDFLSAVNKMSLKKWEIELGMHHHELGLPWDKPVDPSLWNKVAEYCDDDVYATEAVFIKNQSDWIARKILAKMADMTYNDTTNTLTTRFIFGNNKKPQNQFFYRDMSKPVHHMDEEQKEYLEKYCPEMMSERHGDANSLLPYFPGYKFENGKSTYRDVNENNPDPENRYVGEGGRVFARPGIYSNVALLDIASQHPHSLIAECFFGVVFSERFRDIVYARVSIKHEDWDTVNNMLDGMLTEYVNMVKSGEITSSDLANALKTAINSVYGLTSAKFDNPFRDVRNVDNIVAKRGALFMIDLQHAVEERGYTVAHIKTDSIKIPDATPEIIDFVMQFGKRYGYTFEHEATYDRMCLVNKAVYIAKYADAETCQNLYGYVPSDNKKKPGKWTATGTQFAIPYVFKTLFSHEEIEFEDMCNTFSVTSSLYLDLNENLPDVLEYEKSLDNTLKLWKKGNINDDELKSTHDKLEPIIDEGHKRRFIGKVGSFCPIKEGHGGGILVRECTDPAGYTKYDSATGSKGYRWQEAEVIKELGKFDSIDRGYWDEMVKKAIDTISEYGDFYEFVSEEPYIQNVA